MAEPTKATIIADIEKSFRKLSKDRFDSQFLDVCYYLGFTREFKDMRKVIINTLIECIVKMANDYAHENN